MYCRFIVEAWTNKPVEVEAALQKAIDLHGSLIGSGLKVRGRERAIRLDPSQVGKDPGGDPWHFFVEGETNSPNWTLGEIRKAIRNHPRADRLKLQVVGTVLMTPPSEVKETLDDVECWLREQGRKTDR
jgi:hypothetical protein